MTIYHVIITKTGVMNILAESEQEAREIAEDMDKKGTFDMDTLISVEESWSGGVGYDHPVRPNRPRV